MANTTTTTTTAATTTTTTTTTTTNTTATTTTTTSTATTPLVDAQRWLFSKEQVNNSPSVRDGFNVETELRLRQYAALFIQDLGTRMKVSQICINTAIIYMHRFYMVHSFKKFHQNIVAVSCLFFACKVEEHPTPLRKFIDAVQPLLHKDCHQLLDPNSEEYKVRWEEIIAHESCLIQTLGFNVLINHAHTVIIKACQMIKAPRDLTQTAYFIASNSLILTNFSVRFSADRVACFCIYLACKSTGLKIPTSNEGRQWYQYVNPDINADELEAISNEYLHIHKTCPQKIKAKLGLNDKTQEDLKALIKCDENGNNIQNDVPNQSKQGTPTSSTSSKPSITSTGAETAKSYKEYVEMRKQLTNDTSINSTTTTTTATITASKVITTKTVTNPQQPSAAGTQQPSSHHHHQQHQHHQHPHKPSVPGQHGVAPNRTNPTSKPPPPNQQIPHPPAPSQHHQHPPQSNHHHHHSTHPHHNNHLQQQPQHHHNHHQKPPHAQQQPHHHHHQQQQQQHHIAQSSLNKSSPSVMNAKPINSQQNDNPGNSAQRPQQQQTSTNTQSMKRANDDHLSNTAPTKMPKYISEKSVS